MRSPRAFAAMAVAWAGLGFSALPAPPAHAQRTASHSLELAGRTVSCGDVRIVTDRRLPSEGAAAPGVLILNPRMLSEQPAIVRLFVFHHECGHHRVGESELEADCWAVNRGVRDGWLDTKGLGAVCRSFEDAPETATHPSGRRRCRNLDRCFAAASAPLSAKRPVTASAPDAAVTKTSSLPPQLVSGPTLIATGTLRFSDAGSCARSAVAATKDPIGKLVAPTSATPNGCP